MRYNIFRNNAGLYEAVKAGWSWPAFLLTCFWAMKKGLTEKGLPLLFGFIAVILIGAFVNGIWLDMIEFLLAFSGVIIGVVYGENGNGWLASYLVSIGYEEVGIVPATSPQNALAAFLKKGKEFGELERLEKLGELRQKGVLTEEEFVAEKRKILSA